MRPLPQTGRRAIAWLVLVAIAVWPLATGCSKKKSPTAPVAGASRSYFMGFANIPPSMDSATAVNAVLMWANRADAAIWHSGVPWDSLLAGVPPQVLAAHEIQGLEPFWRGHGMTITYEIDPTNGLNRGEEDPALVKAGRSIAEPAIQALFLRWATAIDSLLVPDYLGLASETNLVRAAAPAPVYAALVQLANRTADSLAVRHAAWHRARDPILYSTVQVEVAWGRLGGAGSYVGVTTDLADFHFAGVYGLSAYPYLGGFAEPESLPPDYYSRVAQQLGKPVMIVEGGWTTATGNGVVSDQLKQARYVHEQGKRLQAAHAFGWYQLTFTDLDLANYPPPPPGTSLEPFAHCGLVDIHLVPKPALSPWDSLYDLPHVK